MASRPIVLSLFMAAGVAAATTSSSSPRGLRASAAAELESGPSSADIPNLVTTRRLDFVQARRARNLQDTIVIHEQCINNLAASANDNGQLKKENYFYFTESMSNYYYSATYNATGYDDLPMVNKFGFVTLSCQCQLQGGKGNCCQGNRAKLNVQGIDVENPENMSEELLAYVADICAVTKDSIGDNVMPPTGELPTTESPTKAPTTGMPVTLSPTKKDAPAIVGPPGGPNPGNGGPGSGGDDDDDEGLSKLAWAGIAIAGSAVVTLMIYLLSEKRAPREEPEDDDLSHMSQQNTGKELLAITANGELDPDAPPRQESPDATNSMTMSDVSSIPSMNTGSQGQGGESNYYANHSLLPGRPDDESQLSSSDGPSFFETDDEGTAAGGGEEGMEISTSSALNTTTDSSGAGSLDQAIENGNWEAVAASAAAIVKQNESMSTTSTGAEV